MHGLGCSGVKQHVPLQSGISFSKRTTHVDHNSANGL